MYKFLIHFYNPLWSCRFYYTRRLHCCNKCIQNLCIKLAIGYGHWLSLRVKCEELYIVWHWSFTFNSNKSSTWCNNFPVYYPDVGLQLNMFRTFSRLSSGAQWLQWQHDCHHDTKVKPEAATAVIELLMTGGNTPETCWAVNKRQDNKLKNCCIMLVCFF
jgi:hypothetical protein